MINSLPQLKMAKAILWLLSVKRKNFPNKSAFHCIYRAEIIRKAKVNHQNFSEFVDKLVRELIIVPIPTWYDDKDWWIFEVTENGEKKLSEEVKAFED